MDNRIKEHLTQYNLKNGYGTSEADLIETLMESDVIYSKLYSEHRWWSEYFEVVEIDSVYIGFLQGRTTGDDSAYDKGWEFDPATICEVVPREVKTIIYERV
ncbi:MAG: hypothetical protein WC503_01130 [Candidatus Shapirobacteria bacterium]